MHSARTVLHGSTVIDGQSMDSFQADVSISGGRIVDIGSGLDGDDVVDLTGCWLLPGLIDCHVHLMVQSFDLLQLIDTPFGLSYYLAAANMRQTIAAGITTVRDTGGADLGLKLAQERGLIDGPRVQIAVNLLSMTGGHADHWSACGYATPDFVAHPGRPDGVCDGPEEVLKKTREMIRAGADFIKVCATGGLLSPGDNPRQSQFLPAELEIITAQARASGLRVTAHAQGADGIKNAIRAGIQTIEHGWFLDDEAIDLMREHGTFLVPTLMAPSSVLEVAAGRRTTEIEQAREVLETHRESIGRAVQAGVRIAMGTDSGTSAHGRNLEELVHLTEVGMTPMQAIQASSSVAAENLGIDDRVGSLSVGKVADFAVFSVDPLTDMKGFARPASVREVWMAGRRFGPGGLPKEPAQGGVVQ